MVKPKYRDGMLDGTPLDVAIRQVDEVSPSTWFARLREVKANASALSPNQLVTLDHVDTGDPEVGLTPGPGWGGMPAYRCSAAAGGPTGDISGRWAVC
jgi:hypothetical protein